MSEQDPARPSESGEVTRLLRRWTAGDRAAVDDLLPLVYRDLRELADRYVRRDHGARPRGARARSRACSGRRAPPSHATGGSRGCSWAAFSTRRRVRRPASRARLRGAPSIPGFVVERILGEGGMGSVWLARQTTPVRSGGRG